MDWTRFSNPGEIRCAGLLVVAVATGRVLLLQRPEGTWEQPGGHPEGWELPRETALREFREETAFAGAIAVGSACIDTSTGERAYVVYYAVVDEEFRPVLSEHRSYVWAHPSRLPNATHPGTQRAVLAFAV
jgi:8-oxo-dGTP pyrophosphatase MutT (NUDIX family)